MSRKGKNPVSIPKGVEVKVEGRTVKVKGPKGSLEESMREGIDVAVEGSTVFVTVAEGLDDMGRFHGLYRSLIANMVEGVTKGFEKKLEMIGVGYRAAVKGNTIDLQVGKSHPEQLPIPQGLHAEVDKNTKITISGACKQRVGQFAAAIRSTRPPEPYKGKGIRYEGEYVRRKAGKAGK